MACPTGGRPLVRIASALFLSAASTHAPPVLGQQAPPVFRSSTDLVVVQVAVFASDGGPAPGLSEEDFRLTENGEARSISVFIPPGSGPVEIAMLIDASASMNRWPVRQAALAVLDALEASDPGACVLVMPFRTALHPGIWGHPDDGALRSLITRLRLADDEAIYDALLRGVSLLRTRASTAGDVGTQPPSRGTADLMRFRTPGSIDRILPVEPPAGTCTARRGDQDESAEAGASTRRAVIVLTDGMDTGSRSSVDDVILGVWGARIPVFAFVASAVSDSAEDAMREMQWKRPAVRALERIVQYSGGVVIEQRFLRRHLEGVKSWDAIEKLASALRGHYTLGFVPPAAIDPTVLVDQRAIEVRVPDKYDALFTKDLAVGAGLSYGAALDIALVGFEQLTTGSASDALATFERAAALYPSLGMTYYGQSLALMALERPEEALGALDVARRHAPWIPDLDARQAVLLLQAGRVEDAWEYALRAHAAGSEVSALVSALQARMPRQVDLAAVRQGVLPRVTLHDYVGDTTLAALVAPMLFAGIGRAIEDSQLLQLSMYRDASYAVVLNLRNTEHVNGRNRVAGEVVLNSRDPANKLAEMPFEVRDVSSDEEIAAFGAQVAKWIQTVID